MLHIAILKLKPQATEDAQAKLRRAEVEKVWELIVAGTLRSINFFSGEGHGAVLHLETPDRSSAEAAVHSLPGRGRIAEFRNLDLSAVYGPCRALRGTTGPMSSEALIAMGVVRAKPGQEQELGRRMASLLAPTRAEPGCLAYDLFQSTEDPSVWVLIERWRSVADLDAHVHTNHMAAFLARSGEVLEGPPNNFRLKPVSPATASTNER